MTTHFQSKAGFSAGGAARPAPGTSAVCITSSWPVVAMAASGFSRTIGFPVVIAMVVMAVVMPLTVMMVVIVMVVRHARILAEDERLDRHRHGEGRHADDLRPEIAQIAGRAGRFTSDGQFGETGECAPFDAEMVERVEAHEFETIEAVQWRSVDLEIEAVEALIASLETPPDRAGLLRVRGADDERVLRAAIDDHDLMDHVRGEP